MVSVPSPAAWRWSNAQRAVPASRPGVSRSDGRQHQPVVVGQHVDADQRMKLARDRLGRGLDDLLDHELA